MSVIGPPKRPVCKWLGDLSVVETFMMRFLGIVAALMLGLASAQAAPLDNKDGFWSDWSDATFERAAAARHREVNSAILAA
jgi:hypothetical protein